VKYLFLKKICPTIKIGGLLCCKQSYVILFEQVKAPLLIWSEIYEELKRETNTRSLKIIFEMNWDNLRNNMQRNNKIKLIDVVNFKQKGKNYAFHYLVTYSSFNIR
jgi:hypothetical protein